MLYPKIQMLNTQLLPVQMTQKILILKLLDDDYRDRQSWVAGIDSHEVLKDKATKKNDDTCQMFLCILKIENDKVSITNAKDTSEGILVLDF